MANERFDSIISLVQPNRTVADIGCDHAYVSCELVKRGISNLIYASDVRTGPLECAKANIKKYGFEKNIIPRLADGLDGIEEFQPQEIIIAGMGGELIISILQRCEYVKNSNVHLILQPMTAVYELRQYLYTCGFTVTKELLCRDSGKLYEIISCRYENKQSRYTEAQLHLGVKTHLDPLFNEFLQAKINKFNVIIKGKKKAGLDTKYEHDILNEFLKIGALQ